MADKGKGKAVAAEEPVEAEEEEEEPQWHPEVPKPEPKGPPRNGDWEAIFSPQHNAYYFHNIKTKETTWTNPITTAPKAEPRKDPRSVLQGVDPDLAYLDPNLKAAVSSTSSTAATPATVPGQAYATAGRFNARTGKFEGDPNRNPDWVSDFSRMKRQSSIYFDVEAWEKQRFAEQEAIKANPDLAKKRKPTKKELEIYKARAQEKKKQRLMDWYHKD